MLAIIIEPALPARAAPLAQVGRWNKKQMRVAETAMRTRNDCGQ
jgi:hypothetical protein